jgi:hypothetical protein
LDRGALPDAKVRQVLAHYLGRPDEEDAPWLAEHALAVLGMVDADAPEVDVAAYIRQVARGLGRAPTEVAGARLVAVALWHVVKAARMRDLAERAVRGEIGPPQPTGTVLGERLAARLLTPEELAAHRAARGHPG